MSFGHMFVTECQSQILGHGRYKFNLISETNKKFIYFRFEDEYHKFIEFNNKIKVLSEYGKNLLKKVYDECGGFHYSYVLLEKKEGEEDFAKTLIQRLPQAQILYDGVILEPRVAYFFGKHK